MYPVLNPRYVEERNSLFLSEGRKRRKEEMADQPMEVEENAAQPKTVKELLGPFTRDSNVVNAVKAIIGGELYYDDESFGFVGLEGCESQQALMESLKGNGVPEFLAPGVAEALWAELVKWDPWKKYAFDPAS